MQDSDIIALYLARDERAVAETEKQYGSACRRLAERILDDEGEADECVNDTWLKTWNSIPPARPDSLGAFVCRIARNLAINRYKAAHAKRRDSALTVSLEELGECLPDGEAPGANGLGDLINTFLDSLDPDERRLFMGRYWHNHTPAELARAYGLTKNAVNLRLMRTRDKLRVHLAKGGYKV